MKRDSESVMVNLSTRTGIEWPLVNGLIRIEPGQIWRADDLPPVEVSIQRIEQVQCFARWSMANDPTRRWDQRHQWIRR